MGKLTHDVLQMGVTSPGVDIVLTIKEKCIRGIGTIANMTETLNKMAPNLKATKFCWDFFMNDAGTYIVVTIVYYVYYM